MAWEQVVEGLQYARNAGADLSNYLHCLVKVGTDADIELATAASDKIVGVIREVNTLNNPVTVQFGGVAKVKAGGTIAAGDLLTATTGGVAIATTSAGNRIIGIALEAASVDEIFPVLVAPGSV